MEFHCRLGTPTGEVLEGVYVAEDEAKLRQQLEDKDLYVLSLRQRRFLSRSVLSLPRRRRIGTREFIVFNQELAALLKAGMPLAQSLDILRERTEHPVLKSVLEDVYDRVRGGMTLSSAFEAQGDLFPGVYNASLLAGEQSGDLEEVLRRYIAYARLITGVRRRTISALIYPGILLVMSLVVVAIILLFVTPQFAGFYEDLGKELPLITRLMMASSSFVGQNVLPIVSALVTVGLLGRVWLKQPGRRVLLDRWVLKVPTVGRIVGEFATSQLARTLAMLLRGGLPLVNALDVASRSISNQHFGAALSRISGDVREGQPLWASMSARDLFSPVAIKMVEVGESTGALQDMLTSLADFFDDEIETVLERFLTILEPLLLIIMAVVIAGLLLALYWPLLQLGAIA